MASDEAGMILSQVSERASVSSTCFFCPSAPVGLRPVSDHTLLHVCVCVCVSQGKGKEKREVAEPGKPAASVMTAHGASS